MVLFVFDCQLFCTVLQNHSPPLSHNFGFNILKLSSSDRIIFTRSNLHQAIFFSVSFKLVPYVGLSSQLPVPSLRHQCTGFISQLTLLAKHFNCGRKQSTHRKPTESRGSRTFLAGKQTNAGNSTNHSTSSPLVHCYTPKQAQSLVQERFQVEFSANIFHFFLLFQLDWCNQAKLLLYSKQRESGLVANQEISVTSITITLPLEGLCTSQSFLGHLEFLRRDQERIKKHRLKHP